MKDELQTKMVEILTSIQSTAGQAKDFAMEQLPDIAQSYVVYGRMYATFWMLFAVGSAAFGWCLIQYAKRKHAAATVQFSQDLEEYEKEYEEYKKNPMAKKIPREPYRSSYFEFRDMEAFMLIPFLLAVAVLSVGAQQFFLVWLAPKVWLLKELASLIK